MAVVGKRVNVASTATVISTGLGGEGTPQGTSSFATVVKNLHATAAIDLGGSTVATGAGYSLGAGEAVSVAALGFDDILYGVTASGTVSVCVLEVA